MKDSILMKGCSIPHCKADRLRAVLLREPLVRNGILGCIKRNEADFRYVTTCQEKSCCLEMCTSKDHPASRNFAHCSRGKERGDHCLCQQGHPDLCSEAVGRGSGLVGGGMAPCASMGDPMDPNTVLIQQLPQTSLSPQQQEQGTGPNADISSQSTSQLLKSLIKLLLESKGKGLDPKSDLDFSEIDKNVNKQLALISLKYFCSNDAQGRMPEDGAVYKLL